jgi:thiosulfate dehydrogenase [quinone] large subunit
MILGLFTRPVAVIVSALAFGILISAGWLGTTCLDEWQIGILGVAGGLLLFLSGGGTTLWTDSWRQGITRSPARECFPG